MKNLTQFFLVTLMAAASLRCSTQYRTVESDDWAYMKGSFQAVTANVAADAEYNKFVSLMETPGASLYFADAPGGAYGPVVSVASLYLDFMEIPSLTHDQIEDIKIFFVDVPFDTGRESALMVAIKQKGGQSYTIKTFTSVTPSVIEDGEYVAVLGRQGADRLVLRTPYVDEDEELEEVLRMDVGKFDASGVEVYIGQFSTLVGVFVDP